MRALGASRTSVVPGGALAGGWARNPLWRNARAVPSLDLDFAGNKSLKDGISSQDLVTFTRASSGTFVGSDGLIKTATTNEPRFDHNPTTGESLGLLVEEARTNLLLNSATLSTQSVTVAATANTLSFYGTGTVTLTGVSTAGPLVGTGANNRVSLTFTPAVGVLVVTVSGSVTNAQLEAGAFPTSYIPTTTATVTRAADVASITGANFSSFYNQTEGTLFAEGAVPVGSTGQRALASFDDGTTSERIQIGHNGTTTMSYIVVDGGTTQFGPSVVGGSFPPGEYRKLATALKAADFAAITTPGTVATGSAGTMPTPTQLQIGFGPARTQPNLPIKRITYWPVRLANTTLQQITQP
jgi:hypothetical protein